jgi:hypothetical protein
VKRRETAAQPTKKAHIYTAAVAGTSLMSVHRSGKGTGLVLLVITAPTIRLTIAARKARMTTTVGHCRPRCVIATLRGIFRALFERRSTTWRLGPTEDGDLRNCFSFHASAG